MIIERLKKLREDILNRGAESKKRDKHLVILREVNKYFETHSTENKMFLLNRGGLLNNFDEDYMVSKINMGTVFFEHMKEEK